MLVYSVWSWCDTCLVHSLCLSFIAESPFELAQTYSYHSISVISSVAVNVLNNEVDLTFSPHMNTPQFGWYGQKKNWIKCWIEKLLLLRSAVDLVSIIHSYHTNTKTSLTSDFRKAIFAIPILPFYLRQIRLNNGNFWKPLPFVHMNLASNSIKALGYLKKKQGVMCTGTKNPKPKVLKAVNKIIITVLFAGRNAGCAWVWHKLLCRFITVWTNA